MPCWFTVSSGTRPNAQPKSCTGCYTSSRSSSPWWVSSWARLSLSPTSASNLGGSPLDTSGLHAGSVVVPSPSLPRSPTPQASPAGTLGAGSPQAGTRSQKSRLVGFPLGHLTRSPPHQPCPHTAPLSGLGLVAVFDYHRKKGYADLYSLHSWCGILAFVLYFVQWLVGFGFFLFPGASFSLRSRYRPQHIFFGATIFLLAVGTALLGLKEALLFKLGTKYSTFEPEGILANTLGLLLAGFGVTVLYILTRADWKRPPQAEEQALSMDFKTLTEGDSPSSQ
uniref:Transmembrane ascorbate-dependent reductase CYB561 n=1 Tax=Felis catus TaxID=9685 RepID=A0ABI7Z286_FELCA